MTSLRESTAVASSDRAVEEHHPELHEDRKRQYGNDGGGEFCWRRVRYLVDGSLHKLDAHGGDENGHDEARQVLKAPMTIGMVGIGGLAGHLKPEQAHDIAGGVRKVVHGVGHDGNGSRQKADDAFCEAERDVAGDSDHAGELAVTRAHGGVVGILPVFHEQSDEQVGHGRSFRCMNARTCARAFRFLRSQHGTTRGFVPACSAAKCALSSRCNKARAGSFLHGLGRGFVCAPCVGCGGVASRVRFCDATVRLCRFAPGGLRFPGRRPSRRELPLRCGIASST